METPNPRTWSDLPLDLLTSIFERLSFGDVHNAKIVCRNWYSNSKLKVRKSPWLLLFPDGSYGDDVCVLYIPEEDRFYRNNRDLSGVRFLANSGNWFFVIDSRSNLYIINLFSENMINLPPLESLLSRNHTLKRVGDKEFNWEITNDQHGFHILSTKVLRGLLWVDDKTEDYIVVWFFNCNSVLGFCKKGDDHYNEISLNLGVPSSLRGLNDAVLWRYRLHIYTILNCTRVIDLSGHQAFEHGYVYNRFPNTIDPNFRIAVTTIGEVLLVELILDDTTIDSDLSFRVYKKDSLDSFVEVDSIGDAALLLDSGISVCSIDSNSIYFTCLDSVHLQTRSNLDICVFNCATKTLKRFPSISIRMLKDARWFLPRF